MLTDKKYEEFMRELVRLQEFAEKSRDKSGKGSLSESFADGLALAYAHAQGLLKQINERAS